MAVHEQTPYIEYKANGTTTNFVLPFACKGKDHLIVTVNDLDTDAEDWGFIDNEVKFKYPPFQDSIIKIWRNTPIERRSTFRTFDNSLRPETLNIDLDTLWLVMQELNVRNQVSDKRLQELMGSLVEGQINGLPSEILARISGDELSKLLISIEQNRANKAEILLQNEKASKLELSNGLAPKADKTYVDQRVIDGKEYDQTFDTEAELRAYTPIKIGFLAKAWDTRKVFRYVAGVEKWKDLGLSEKDLANQYTDEKSQQLSQKINDIQTLDFYTKEAQQHQWQGLDGVGNILIAVDAEGNFQQNYHYDFHIKPESPSFQIVDRNLNLIFGNSDLYLRDFFTKKNEIAFITVDQNFNILNSNNQQDTDLDFSELNYSALNPNALKNKEPYLNYSKLCVQQDFTDDLYIKDSFEIFKKHTDVYDFYDVLKAQHPDRVSSEVLGYDGLNNEIRQYSYTPKLFEDDGTNGWTSAEMQPIKLVVTTGVHGIERDSVLQFAVLFNEILNRSNEIEEASFLSQFRIVIVPMICPNGYDANTRNNHNGVNINRNAPAGWSKWANGEAGQKPLDQPETQVACSLPQLHSDASVFVDFHNYNAGIYRSGWYGTSKLETLNVVKRIAMKIQASIQKDFNYLKKNPIRIAKNTGGTTCLDWQETSKKKGYLFETPLFGGTRPLYENRQYGLFVIRTALTEIMKHEIGA